MLETVSLSCEGERQRWNAFVADSRWGHALQSWEWGEFKQSMGWRAERISVQRNGQILAGAQLLLKPLPSLPMTIAYIPKGPIVDLTNESLTLTLLTAIHQVARNHRAVFLKIEPHLLDDAAADSQLRQYGFARTVHTNQPRSTIVIDLANSRDILLKNMRKTTRKLIQSASYNGVQVESGGPANLDILYDMMTSAAKRKGHTIHEKRFFRQQWHAFQATNSMVLLVAKYRKQVVAVKMILVFADKSMHLWGGVSATGRKVYANHLLQWAAIQWAMEQGCKYCDLWGIPDQVGEMIKTHQAIPKDRCDGLWGTFMFKRGFGGSVEYYIGAYDYAYQPRLYWLGMNLLVRNKSVSQVSAWMERIFGVR